MKVVVLDGYLVNHDAIRWKVAEAFPDLQWYEETPPDQIAARIGNAEIVFANRAMLNRNTLQSCPNLRYIGVFGTGYNIVDLMTADQMGITVCNIPSYSSRAVAQSTAALMLAVSNQVVAYDRFMKAGKWQNAADRGVTAISTMELSGKTVGILGYGEIGRAFGEICRAFGMRVLAYRRNPVPEKGVSFVNLETLQRESDILSVHCPLTDATRGMINRSFLAKMKKGAVLLNTARGAILDESAVAEALDNGQLSGIGLDVFAKEPAGLDNPLVGHPKSVVTPHVSWAARETRERMLEIAAENLFAFLEGHPQNVVNHPQK
ncbi:MAG: D-2-hydroxyacid dehydrogenase [Candidatus Merdivicinus sp.]|jgi:glycerate dehydrogenase